MEPLARATQKRNKLGGNLLTALRAASFQLWGVFVAIHFRACLFPGNIPMISVLSLSGFAKRPVSDCKTTGLAVRNGPFGVPVWPLWPGLAAGAVRRRLAGVAATWGGPLCACVCLLGRPNPKQERRNATAVVFRLLMAVGHGPVACVSRAVPACCRCRARRESCACTFPP